MANDRLNNIKNVLHHKRVSQSAMCECGACRQAIQEAVADGWECESCGYRGKPYAAECACYDNMCHGGKTRGAGCFHGCLCCPVCDEGEGEVSISEILIQIRRIVENPEDDD